MELERETKLSLDKQIAEVKEEKNPKLLMRRAQGMDSLGARRVTSILDIEFEQNRLGYIKKSMNHLIKNDVYSSRTIEVMRQVFVDYNIDMREILLDCRDDIDEYYYTAVVIYKMIKSGLFTEEEYLDVAEYSFTNAYQAEKFWKKLLKDKTENKKGKGIH